MLPTFLIIGAMKSGTTSLYAYLKDHPDIGMPLNKEPNFFSDEKLWARGIGWYAELFDSMKGKKAIGEASVSYTKYPYYAGVPQRIAATIPKVKLIYVLRNPIERIYSHYLHNVFSGIEDEPLEEALASKPLYIQASQYYMQLDQYLQVFEKEQISVLLLDDLQKNPQEFIKGVFDFISVDSSFTPKNIKDIMHKSSSKRGADNVLMKMLRKTNLYHSANEYFPSGIKKMAGYLLKKRIEKPAPMSIETHAMLVSRLRDDISRLSEYLQRDLSKWTTFFSAA